MTYATPMIGRRVGTIEVLSESASSTPRDKCYRVRCWKCGSQRNMRGGNIRRAERHGLSGCKCSSKAVRHGLHERPAYKTWEGMVSRCHNPKHVAFPRYGGRGIEVVTEWRESPAAFIDWAERHGFQPGKQLDRRDNDAGYSPENCRFVTPSENMNNRSNNRIIVVDGRRMTIAQAAKAYRLNKTTIRERLNRGWSDRDSVKPVGGAS